MTLNVTQQDLLEILTAEGANLDWWQMGARAAVVYVVAITIVRMGKKRFFGKSAAMDIVIGVILGSVMSRTINGSVTLLPTICAAVVLVGLHAISARLAYHSSAFGTLVKGRSRLLIKDGQEVDSELGHSLITKGDLEEAARSQGKFSKLEQIEEAHLERDGNISVIPKDKPLRIVEVKVENGVQTVRLVVG